VAKLPSYMKIVPNKTVTNKPSAITVSISIKWWGWLLLTYECMKRFDLKWYHWLRYPEMCWSVRRGMMRDNDGSGVC